jgi:hypothetical protein
MWHIDLAQLKARLFGGGGSNLAGFVDRLIRAEARGRIPASEVDSQLRANIKDGGVDTKVNQPIPGDRTGWFGVPTAWQYKAQEASDIDPAHLRKEINSPEVKLLIEKGYGYRLCIAGDLPPKKRREWESILLSEAQRINPQAPPPLVVALDKIQAWASSYPSTVLALIGLGDHVLDHEQWKAKETTVTPAFVPLDAWHSQAEHIAAHVDLEVLPPDACLSVQGAAGAGKTRLVLETLSAIDAACPLIAYADDPEVAVRVARHLAGTDDTVCVLVADECDAATRKKLNDILVACRERVRVVCIDNSGLRPVGGRPEIEVPIMGREAVATVLEKNFPHIPSDIRQAFASLAGGFVRIAAALCKHWSPGQKGVGVLPSGDLEEYVHLLVKDGIEVLAVLSMLEKVGFRREVEGELVALCEATGLDAAQCREVARRMKTAPGFVAEAGRYLYVTPEIVARIAFAEAWRRWVAADPQQFISQKLSSALGERFIERARAMGGEEVLAEIAGLFRGWLVEQTPETLSSERGVKLLSTLVESDPDRGLPALRALVNSATPEQLRRVPVYGGGREIGPRRQLVWLCERLMSFPEYFRDSERILFRLALNEVERGLGNSATGVWKQAFQVHLSGTATPFLERLKVLERRLQAEDPGAMELSLDALHGALQGRSHRMDGYQMVGGRLRPEDWHPASGAELRACYVEMVEVLSRLLSSASDSTAGKAAAFTASHTGVLLGRGLLEECKSLISAAHLSEEQLAVVLSQAQSFVDIERQRSSSGIQNGKAEYLAAVEQWIQDLEPTDFAGRLKSLVSRNPWDRRVYRAATGVGKEVQRIADEIVADPKLLSDHWPWLLSDMAPSADVLGMAAGKQDRGLVLLSALFGSAIRHKSVRFLRGYVRGLLNWIETNQTSVRSGLEALVTACPELGMDVVVSAGDLAGGVTRALSLVEEGHVPAAQLGMLAFGAGGRSLDSTELARVVCCLADRAHSGDAESRRAGINLVASTLYELDTKPDPAFFAENSTRECVWRLMEGPEEAFRGIEGYHWNRVAEVLSKWDSRRAVGMIAKVLLWDAYDLRGEAEACLTAQAKTNPIEVMEALGDALMDPERGALLQLGVHRDIVAALPAAVVTDWLQKAGSPGALVLARHVPRPFVDEAGTPVVPSVTEYLLEHFGEDEAVFRSFCIGVHGSETWVGDPTDQILKEADEALLFIEHPLPKVREWAALESEGRRKFAADMRQENEERFL